MFIVPVVYKIFGAVSIPPLSMPEGSMVGRKVGRSQKELREEAGYSCLFLSFYCTAAGAS